MIRDAAGLFLQSSPLRTCFHKTITGKIRAPGCNVWCDKKLDFFTRRPDLDSQITVVKGQSKISVTSLIHFPVEIPVENISLGPLPGCVLASAFLLLFHKCQAPTQRCPWGNRTLSPLGHRKLFPSLSHFIFPTLMDTMDIS